MHIGLFYGSSTCYTEMVAEKIQQLLGTDLVQLHNLKDTPLERMQDYDILILGISTWDFGELQEDWEARWPEISALDLNDTVIALYGMGDQVGYTEWFQDALGMLHHAIAHNRCDRIGFWPNQGYEFEASKALTEDGEWFYGLALDDENQYELTDERLQQWVAQLLAELEQL